MNEPKTDDSVLDLTDRPPANPLPKSKKRKGDTLEAPKRKKKKTKEKPAVKSNYQCLQAIERKTSFDIYTSYTRIDLTNSYIGPVGAKLLGDALKSASLVVELCLADNHLPSKRIAPILASLPSLVMLESLDLSRNKLSDTDAKLIWEFMATNQTLTKLDLSNNDISLNGEWVSEPLKKSKISHLILNNNPIGDSGVGFLAAGLTENDCLEMLKLEGTEITSLDEIVSLLELNTALKCISLSGCPIKKGYDRLYEVLKYNKTLVELNLQNVGLSLANLSAFVNVMSENTTLRFMRIAKNGLPAEIIKAFRQLLWTRRELRVVNKLADESEISYNVCTEEETEEDAEREEEQACDVDLCDWPDYESLRPHQFEDATEILSLYPEVHINVIVKKELDTHSMKTFYSNAMAKLTSRLNDLEEESSTNNTVLKEIMDPLKEKETLVAELEEKKQKLKLRIQEVKRELNEYQIEYLKKKIPAVLTEDILKASKLNAESLSDRQRVTTAQFEAQQQKMQQPLVEWSTDDVAMLLRELNIGQYRDKFLSNKIDGGVLVNLNTSDLMQDLGMEWKDAKRLQRAIFLLNNHHSIYENPPGVFCWDTDATCQWLATVGFDKYSEVFRKHKVTGQELLLINKYDLSSVFKIDSLVDKVALELAIKDLLQADDPNWKRDPSVVVKQQPLKQEKHELNHGLGN